MRPGTGSPRWCSGALLADRGFGSLRAGIVLTALIAGTAVASLVVGCAGRPARAAALLRRCSSWLVAVAGALVAAGAPFWLLLVVALTGDAVDRCGGQRAGHHAGAGDARGRGCRHRAGVRALQRGRRRRGCAGRVGRGAARHWVGHGSTVSARGGSRCWCRSGWPVRCWRLRLSPAVEAPAADAAAGLERCRACPVAAGRVARRGAPAGRAVRGRRGRRWPGHHRVPVLLLHPALRRVRSRRWAGCSSPCRWCRRSRCCWRRGWRDGSGWSPTMVGTHLPSNVLLACVAFAPTFRGRGRRCCWPAPPCRRWTCRPGRRW